MLESVRREPGVFLPLDDYLAEAPRERKGLADVVNKIERRQYFDEGDDPSWLAFTAGDWDSAVRFNEADRTDLLGYFSDQAARGVVFQRVRVVEFPITPYVQWEMNALKVRAECGEKIRVVTASAVRDYEGENQIPEVLVLGSRVMYEILYDERGVPFGSRRITDESVVSASRGEIERLYSMGEDIADFYERELVRLPPPDVSRLPS
ncbi:hypothetical protein ALI144C_38015 [Actinosynnema sp. ALI-1.44]|uniref:DUF6879 family protein n=1 Tax=Actinosynnema sp. ALI-1.44 TaxID=1933779 RepID=UPI00097CAAE5|nr:DUF6879 family protein [Actinosynnema sp. ALI-1.44]ONI74636.1 hypothetical protein ALI144C_38015 [Actinosynnema sp. ALI-1.44]